MFKLLELLLRVLDNMLRDEKPTTGKIERAKFYSGLTWKEHILPMIKLFRTGKRNSVISMGTENEKVKPTDTTGFLIFSIPAIMTCPKATALCLKYCYAKTECRYDSIAINRVSNFLESLKPDFITNCIAYIRNAVYCKNGRVRKEFQRADGTIKEIKIRIHESGDFYSAEYFRKWCEIARAFPDFKFYAYTKSLDFVIENKELIPDNFTVRFSIFPDTDREQIKKCFKHKIPFYAAVKNIRAKTLKLDFICDCSVGCGGCACQCEKKKTFSIITELKKN